MKPRQSRTAETAVAAPVVAWLRQIGWRVYQEVQLSRGGARPDIVATWRDRLVWIVECKSALSWDLLCQAASWRGQAHRISVAVPDRAMHVPTGRRGHRRDDLASVEAAALRALGLGMLTTGPTGARERVPPSLLPANRRDIKHWWRCLRPEHEAGFAAAGTNGGGYWTPFRGTVAAIAAELRERPGLTTRELVAAVDHHYGADAAAVRNLVRWLGTTALEGTGLVARRDGAGGPWRWSVDPLAEQLGRCREPVCAMPALCRCVRCGAAICAICVPEHRCRCTGPNWCLRPGVRICGCSAAARRAAVPSGFQVICAGCPRCNVCEARRGRGEG